MNPDETTIETTIEEESNQVEGETSAPPADNKELASALAQKKHWREKAEKAEAEKKALEEKLTKAARGDSAPLAVEDYIDISASLDGLDPREKAYLAEQHRLTQKPLRDIRGGEDFQLWQSAYRAKQEKERALAPNTTQELEQVPTTLTERLRVAQTLEDKEKILKDAGLYRDPRPRADRTNIGQVRPR